MGRFYNSEKIPYRNLLKHHFIKELHTCKDSWLHVHEVVAIHWRYYSPHVADQRPRLQWWVETLGRPVCWTIDTSRIERVILTLPEDSQSKLQWKRCQTSSSNGNHASVHWTYWTPRSRCWDYATSTGDGGCGKGLGWGSGPASRHKWLFLWHDARFWLLQSECIEEPCPCGQAFGAESSLPGFGSPMAGHHQTKHQHDWYPDPSVRVRWHAASFHPLFWFNLLVAFAELHELAQPERHGWWPILLRRSFSGWMRTWEFPIDWEGCPTQGTQ